MKVHPFRMKDFVLDDGRSFRFAQWLHPMELPHKEFSSHSQAGWDALIPPGSVCVDVGACTGDTTVPMALAAGPSGAVYAFEPNPAAYEVLIANANANPDLNIVPRNAAIMPAEGRYVFHYTDEDFCNGGCMSGIDGGVGTIGNSCPLTVSATRLDRADIPRRVDFLKIDTEGSDGRILEAHADWIRSARPSNIMFEVYSGSSRRELIHLYHIVSALGYVVPEIDEDAFVYNPNPLRDVVATLLYP